MNRKPSLRHHRTYRRFVLWKLVRVVRNWEQQVPIAVRRRQVFWSMITITICFLGYVSHLVYDSRYSGLAPLKPPSLSPLLRLDSTHLVPPTNDTLIPLKHGTTK